MDWLEFAKVFGLPSLIIVALGYFFSKSIWPFIMKQVELAQQEGKQDREKFMEALERRDKEFSALVGQMRVLTLSIDAIRDELKDRPCIMERAKRNSREA